MACEYEVGDSVVVDGMHGTVIEIVDDLGGECFIRVGTQSGDVVVSCDSVSRA